MDISTTSVHLAQCCHVCDAVKLHCSGHTIEYTYSTDGVLVYVYGPYGVFFWYGTLLRWPSWHSHGVTGYGKAISQHVCSRHSIVTPWQHCLDAM